VKLRLADIAAAVGGRMVGDDVGVGGVSIDSRTVAAGELFVPIVAERDGHDFIAGALDGGAAAYLSSGPEPVDAPHVLVDDTAQALPAMAGAVRPALGSRVIGITGSVGKTSTKDLVTAALSAGLLTHASYRSFNNELGVPLTLLNAPDGVEAVVVEMGARGVGHIRELCRFVAPTIGVVTRVGAAHTELFGSVEAVAGGKGELIEALPASGWAVLNADDPLVAAMARLAHCEVVGYGLEHGDVRAEAIALDNELRPTFTARTPWGNQHVRLGVAGVQNVSNALAAMTVGVACGLDLPALAAGLGRAEMSPWRMDVHRGSSGALVINDSYNANPMSTDAALRSLAAVDADRRVAVLGVMAELGDEHDESHRAMSELATELGIEVLAFDEAAYGVDVLTTHDDVLDALGDLDERDAVLVKGSRVAGLEALAQRL
jgi:UDP-N-acetylmuramoyl-tripeptide--D-alanyl-D-alanine ligase